jgi:PST family polysaccharide transporter
LSADQHPESPGEDVHLKEHNPFRTDHLLKNLSGRAISGGFMTAIAQTFRFGIYMASTLVLARLLSKEDFGLVAMVGTLTSFLRLFREAGLSNATMQKEHITHAQVSNLFWINVALGTIAAGVGAALSPGVAWFFKDERLIGITIALTFTFFISGSSVQHLALLNREMRFKALAMVDIVSGLVGAAAGVAMALTRCGYWSLVGSQVATSLAEAVMAWTISSWRPQRPQRNAGTRSMLSFGASLTFSTLLRRITGGTDGILIGRFWGAEPLGVYSRGQALLMRPLDQMILPFDIVFVPILSRLQTQPERYRSTYLQIYSATALVSFPIAGLLMALSGPLVILMLGPHWESVIPIFAALSITALFFPIICSTTWLTTTQKRNKDIVLIGTMTSFLSVASCVVALPYGINGLAWAVSLSGLLIRLPWQFHIVGGAGPVSRKDLWSDFLWHLPLWLTVTASVYLTLHALPPWSPLAQILCCTPVGLLAAALTVVLVPRQRMTAANLIRRARDYLSEILPKLTGKSPPVG